MKQMFAAYPKIEGERIRLLHFQDSDAEALSAFCKNEKTKRFIPTFLYEQKYEDKHLVIDRLVEEQVKTGVALLYKVADKENNNAFLGIAELYNYVPERNKIAVGIRLDEKNCGKGIGSETLKLMIDYLFSHTDIAVVTSHVITDNTASRKMAEKFGFQIRKRSVAEDWGFVEKVIVNKYILYKDDYLKRLSQK